MNGDSYSMRELIEFIESYDKEFDKIHKNDTNSKIEVNKIINGENLKVLKTFPANSIDLIYLDPPFFSGSKYSVEKKTKLHRQIMKFEDDIWDCDKTEYLKRMYMRLKELHRILKSTGTIYLHCDHHASHWLKTIMDEIFGEDKFISEVVWEKYPSAFGSKRNKQFPMVHDSIFVYYKKFEPVYNIQTEPYPNKYFDKFKNPDNDPLGSYKWEHYPTIKHKPTEETLKENEEYIKNCGVSFLKQSEIGLWYYKRYLNDPKKGDLRNGRPVINIWKDIKRLNNSDYPTQKPDKLLERIILASSNSGDTVLDPFVGGGTTVAMAAKHKRNFIGIDQSPFAAEMSFNRVSQYPSSVFVSERTTIEEVALMNPWIFQEWGIYKVRGITTNPNPGNPSGGDGGIDGYVKLSDNKGLWDESEFVNQETYNKWNDTPISVEMRISSENDVDAFVGAIKRHNKKTGIFIALGFTHTKEKFVKYDDIEVLLLTAEELCKVDIIDYEKINEIFS